MDDKTIVEGIRSELEEKFTRKEPIHMPDITKVATDVFELKKLLFRLFQQKGWKLPPDVLDGPVKQETWRDRPPML